MKQANRPGLSGRLGFIATPSAFVRLMMARTCAYVHAECNVIYVMGYTRAESRYDYARVCTVDTCTRVRAIGVTPSFPVRLVIPAVMPAIKDNDASRRFAKRAARFVKTTENESDEEHALISW